MELALSAKEVVLRIDRGMSTSFRVNAPDDYDGSAQLRVYAVGATLPITIAASLDGGDFVFDIDDSVSAMLPRHGRYAVVWVDAGGDPHAIMKGAFFADGM